LPNLKKLVKRCMDSTLYCSIATSGNGGIWIAPVAFAADSAFNIYFLSSPKSRHMKSIARDGRVAASIFTTQQKAAGPKIGIQLEGNARLLTNGKEVEKAYRTYFSKLPKWKDTDVSYFKDKGCEWPFVMIRTKALYYFNNGVYGEERKRVK
jgi:uncharacterized protein YhbP (UPF0306 family)